MSVVYSPGRYTGLIESQYFTESSKRKTLGFCLIFRVQKSLDQPSLRVNSYPRTLTWWITEGNAKRVLQDLRRLGYTGEGMGGIDPDSRDFHDFAGLEVEVVCTHESGSWGDPFESWVLAETRPNLKDKSKLQHIDRFLAQGRINGSSVGIGSLDDSTHGVIDSDVPF